MQKQPFVWHFCGEVLCFLAGNDYFCIVKRKYIRYVFRNY